MVDTTTIKIINPESIINTLIIYQKNKKSVEIINPNHLFKSAIEDILIYSPANKSMLNRE